MTATHDVDAMTSASTEAGGLAVSRRQLMRTAAVAGTVLAAGAGLAACSSDSTGSTGSTGSSGSSGSSGGGSGPQVLGKTADIPVGGGVVYPSQHVVVTQPTAGTFKGFSSTCTHLGCTVNKVADGLIQCPCHGSKYSVTDGSVQAGPAPKALPAEQVSVKGGQVVLGT